MGGRYAVYDMEYDTEGEGKRYVTLLSEGTSMRNASQTYDSFDRLQRTCN